MASVAHRFKTFPEFSELKLSDRDAYNELIAKYPPISEISFSSLMTWWSALENCKIALLNDNVVISYWLPGDETNSGLSLVGTNKIDESICEIFDYQKAKGQECKLVHVPEFVLTNINFPDMYRCEQEMNYCEPILDNSKFESMPIFIRLKMRAFFKATQYRRVELRRIDLTNKSNQDLIVDCYFEWRNRKHLLVVNRLPKHAEQAFFMTLKNADTLKQQAVGLFIDDKMHSFTIYESSGLVNYKILKYSGFSCEISGLYEYACASMAKQFMDESVKYVNMAIHIGDAGHTSKRLALRPVEFFRKYIVSPQTESFTTTAEKTKSKSL